MEAKLVLHSTRESNPCHFEGNKGWRGGQKGAEPREREEINLKDDGRLWNSAGF